MKTTVDDIIENVIYKKINNILELINKYPWFYCPHGYSYLYLDKIEIDCSLHNSTRNNCHECSSPIEQSYDRMYTRSVYTRHYYGGIECDDHKELKYNMSYIFNVGIIL